MTATDPIYASTSTLNPETKVIGQPQFRALTGLPQFLGQQFKLQLPDQSAIQLPSSSQQQVLHIRASDGLQVPENSVEDEEAKSGLLESTARTSSETQELYNCTVCELPIRDRYLYKVLEQCYHEACLRCTDCQQPFQNSCYSKQGRIYCRDHFFRRFGPKCSRCAELIGEKNVVRKANGHVYHLECFKCVICEKELSTGDQFYLIPMDGRLVCRNDYENSTKEAYMDCGNKRPRTTISAKSLETLKAAYQMSSKPARHVREQLAAETGLDMRVVQVWFQNRRAKEKRLKKDAGRNRWPTSALFNRTIDSDSGSNDESLTGRSPLYGTATYMENSSDMEVHSEIGYGEYFSSAWTPLSRYSSEEHNYINNADSAINAGMIGIPQPTPMHSALEHNIYSEISPVTNPMQIPPSVAGQIAPGCGLAQSSVVLPSYTLNAPPHGLSMMSQPIGINDLPPYSH